MVLQKDDTLKFVQEICTFYQFKHLIFTRRISAPLFIK